MIIQSPYQGNCRSISRDGAGDFARRSEAGGHFVFRFDREHGVDGGAGFVRDGTDDLGEPVGAGFAVEGAGGGQLAVLDL